MPGPLLFLVALVLSAVPAEGQRIDRPLRVFLDCTSFSCDTDYFVQEVPWVAFVRDRQDADVHVLGTRATTGGGGSSYTFELRGRGPFEGERLTVGTTTAADATEEDRRAAFVEVVALALVPFARWTPAPPIVEVRAPAGTEGAASPEADPWNRWSFRVGGNGFLSGESRQSSISVSGSASASRVTDDWKTIFGVRTSSNRSRFELDDSTTFTSRRESFGANALIARSVGPHLGVGTLVEWERSSYANYDASVVLGAAAEYNVFPYAESTRRLLTLLYAIGPRYNDYDRATIFDANRETLLQQLLVVSYDVTEPWGNIDVFGMVDHYIARFGDGAPWADPQFSAEVGGGLEVRLFRGLSAYAHGSVAMIRNQIQLAAEGLTEEEILTQQRELATNYRHFAGLGIQYRFGSIFTQIVNPRFDRFD